MTVQILQGDCRELLEGLTPQSVNCIVTSPPLARARIDGDAGLFKEAAE